MNFYKGGPALLSTQLEISPAACYDGSRVPSAEDGELDVEREREREACHREIHGVSAV